MDRRVDFDREGDLCCAAIQQACKEYRNAYKKQDKYRVKYLEEYFFYAPIFELWTLGEINPDTLLREIRRQVEKNEPTKMYQMPRRTPQDEE